ncbi:hypothetical protein pEaSNUABM10_00175 [Erwinia phage pEa_SNUABM_10]|nr:hypothetical protein pEaSNUABM10_00175 [Erwinia phage pEa_SNUABM_10]
MTDAPQIRPPTELSIVTTSKCNLDCSFCGGAYYMDTKDVGREIQREALFEQLEKYPTLQGMNWTGGEPLMATRKIEPLLAEVKARYPHLTHELYTNGLKMRLEHLPMLQQFNRICVSFDGYKKSERPLWRVVEDGAFEAFEVMAALNNVHTWAVVTREQLADKYWHTDLLDLHRALYHYGFKDMTLLLDNRMKKPLNQDLVMNFMFGYNKMEDQIERLNVMNNGSTGFSISKFFEQSCNACSGLVRLDSDASIGYTMDVEMEIDSGCNMLAKVIGQEAYRYINRTIHARKHRNEVIK